MKSFNSNLDPARRLPKQSFILYRHGGEGYNAENCTGDISPFEILLFIVFPSFEMAVHVGWLLLWHIKGASLRIRCQATHREAQSKHFQNNISIRCSQISHGTILAQTSINILREKAK